MDKPHMTNVDITSDGVIRPRKGFKTFSGMVWQLWLINRRFSRMNVEGNFTVKLPLPEGDFESKYVTKTYKPKYENIMHDYIEMPMKGTKK